MYLVKIYMKNCKVIEFECENFEVKTENYEIKEMNIKRIVGDEKIMFIDLKNIEFITAKSIQK